MLEEAGFGMYAFFCGVLCVGGGVGVDFTAGGEGEDVGADGLCFWVNVGGVEEREMMMQAARNARGRRSTAGASDTGSGDAGKEETRMNI